MDQSSSVFFISIIIFLSASSIGWSQSVSGNETPQFQELPAGAASDQAPMNAAGGTVTAPPVAVVDPPAMPGAVVAASMPMKHKNYRVRIWQTNGECLWRISEKVYGDRHKWRLIYMANRDVIHDPNKIYPNERLKIPPLDRQP